VLLIQGSATALLWLATDAAHAANSDELRGASAVAGCMECSANTSGMCVRLDRMDKRKRTFKRQRHESGRDRRYNSLSQSCLFKNSNAVIFIKHDHHNSYRIGQWRCVVSGELFQMHTASSPPQLAARNLILLSASSAVN
jgi:hypothetical protein